ncbi:hypothetical protein [Salinarimonas sp.]|uniref:hypothetical protein n=1 Tax=Salinarimonas sp. TaxID=2766526 RepID=UPI0032D96C9D
MFHRNVADLYAWRIAALEERFGGAERPDDAIEPIRSMIEKIVVVPREGGGVALTLHGDLARILTLCAIAGEGRARTAESPAAFACGALCFGCGGRI